MVFRNAVVIGDGINCLMPFGGSQKHQRPKREIGLVGQPHKRCILDIALIARQL
jgi:hypothetical protein